MSLFSDIKAVLIPKQIVFKEVKQETEGIYSFSFEPSEQLNWKAGQHGIFIIKHAKIKKGTRPFSIASSPLENKIMITMKIGKQPSDYKKTLLEMKAGMKMVLRGPIGPLYMDLTKPACFIAGGIGITPFRAMLKDLVMREKEFKGKVNLLYINNTGDFLYEKELSTFSNKDHIQIDYFTDKEKLAEKIKEITSSNVDTMYFLAGPKQMNNSIKGTLLGQAVKKKNIKMDTFLGY